MGLNVSTLPWEEIEQLKNKLLTVETERDELRDRMFNNKKEIQKKQQNISSLMKKMDFQPP